MYVFKEHAIEIYNTNYQVAYVFVFVFVFRVTLKDVIDQKKINVWRLNVTIENGAIAQIGL